MLGTFTVTGALGPGLTTTAVVYNNVSNFSVDFNGGSYSISYTDANGQPHTVKYEYANVATITWTPATQSVTISS